MTSPALRLGILGCANIARQFAQHVAPGRAMSIAAVASRDAAKAAAFAAEFRRPHEPMRHHGSYEALLDDDGIDAIYIPLPNNLHAPWAIAAARRGKHVLCAKPLALGRDEARSMFDAAHRAGVFLLESYPWWFQPQTAALRELLRDIGEVRTMQATSPPPRRCTSAAGARRRSRARWTPRPCVRRWSAARAV